MLRSKIYIVVAVMILLGGCRTLYAPLDKLPKDPEAFIKSGKGGWLTLRMKAPHPDAGKRKGGEFLFQDSAFVYILADTVLPVQKSMVDMAALELMEKRPYAWWWILGSISSISHGFGLIFTFPAWHVVGISATWGEFLHDVYRQDRPNQTYWQGINVLARFPGGIGDNEKLRISLRE